MSTTPRLARLFTPLSIGQEDVGMDREWGAQDALAFVRRSGFQRSEFVFDEAMQRSER